MKNVSDLGLIKTKYSMPMSGKRLLPRQALNTKLDGSRTCKLTVITAPAGYGKTSAVLKWLENETLPHAWLSIDAGDNDVFLF
jgi:LuxR family maltose regulon positive regulatory protein